MKNVAIIDLGTNSARLLILGIYKDQTYRLIYTQKTPLRLSQKIDKNGYIIPSAIEEIIKVSKNFSHMCELFNVSKRLSVATAAMRLAKNGANIIKRINDIANIDIKIITGEEEAHYGYLGVVNSIDIKDAVLFDLGGGSLELIHIQKRKVVNLVSINAGASTMTTKYDTSEKLTDNALEKLTEDISSAIIKLLPGIENTKLPIIAIGGTARNVAKIYQKKINYPYPKIHNYSLTKNQFNEVFDLLRNTPIEKRRKISGLTSDRADIILAGTAIINTILKVTDTDKMIISGCGLREGVFYDYYLQELGAPSILDNILEFSLKNTMHFTLPTDIHSKKVAKLAKKMFKSWRSIHGLENKLLRVLNIAAKLHDIGISINYYNHAKHTSYLIQNAPLMGLTHKEQAMAALVASWHNNSSPKNIKDPLIKALLDEKDILNARKLALLVALAERLDFTESDVVKDIFPNVSTDKKAFLCISSDKYPEIEIDEVKQLIPWFKKDMKTELIIQTI